MNEYNFKKKVGVVNVRLDPDLKDEVEKILKPLGFNIPDVVRSFLEQIAITQGLPVEVNFNRNTDNEMILTSTLLEDLPNAETQEVMRKSKRGEDVERFDSVDEMFEDLIDENIDVFKRLADK